MIGDVLTVAWKEWREFLLIRGSYRAGVLSLFLILGVFGVFLPLNFGPEMIQSPVLLIYWAWMPVMLVISLIADAFAGERERHTLETLLASRLSDRAILLGKIVAGISYGWGVAMVGVMLAVVTVNLAHRGGGLIVFTPGQAVTIVVGTLLTAAMAATGGVLASLRAATVRQAQQFLMLGMMALIFIPAFGSRLLPEPWRHAIAEFAGRSSMTTIVVILLAILVAVDLFLFALASARFQRHRLILD